MILGLPNNNVQRIRILNLILFTVLYILRRPADALYPAVWNEDGFFNIPQALDYGWSSLFIPVNGYLIIPSKFITLLSLSVSGLFYPEIAYLLTLIITLLVMVIITSSLVDLPKKEYLPLIIALLPYDPEVFSTPLYIFWWTSLLLIVPLFSGSQTSGILSSGIKISATIIGCLGSPISVLLMPAIILKTYIKRSRLNYFILAVWSGLSAIQMYFSVGEVGNEMNLLTFSRAFPQVIGTYIMYNHFFSTPNSLSYLFSLMLLLIGSIALYCTLILKKYQFLNTSLAFLAVLSTIFASWLRTNFAVHPFLAGPRFFFFPYIFLSIFLLAIYSLSPPKRKSIQAFSIKGVCLLLLIVSCTTTWIQNPALFSRYHHPLNWRYELYNCLASPDSYDLRIHFNGDITQYWEREYSRDQCRQIAQSGLLSHWYELDKTWIQEFKRPPDTRP